MVTTVTRPTHQQIADAVGVSRVAVSQVLHRSQHARIGPEKQREIERMALLMGYRPRNFTTHNIGYVGKLNALALLGENRFMLLVDRALRQAKFRLLLTSLDDEDPACLRETLNPKTVDGVIFTRWFDGRVKGLLAPEIPYVVVSDEDAITPDVDCITMDSAATMDTVVTHLIQLGHSRIALVGNPGTGSVTSHLKMGAHNALQKAGLVPEIMSLDVVTDLEIAEPLIAAMRVPQAPTAFVTFGAEKAVTVLNILQYLKLTVPRDASLVSIVDSHLLTPMLPAISTTTASGQSVAEAAVNRLLGKIENPASPAQHIFIPGTLIHRQSIGPAPQ